MRGADLLDKGKLRKRRRNAREIWSRVQVLQKERLPSTSKPMRSKRNRVPAIPHVRAEVTNLWPKTQGTRQVACRKGESSKIVQKEGNLLK